VGKKWYEKRTEGPWKGKNKAKRGSPSVLTLFSKPAQFGRPSEIHKNMNKNKYSFLLSRRLRMTGHVARMGETRGAYRVLVGKPEGRNHLEDPDLDGRLVLRWIFEKWDGGMEWIDLAQDRDRWLL
jgi:hypothetical protein